MEKAVGSTAGTAMIDKEIARGIALSEINKLNPHQVEPIDLVLVDQHTIEKEYGWVFFYQSRQYVETGDFDYILGGNSPFLVQREDGQVFYFGTAYPVEWFMAGYEAGFRLRTGKLTILRVIDIDMTLSCLHRLRLSHIIPELACGVEWRIPQMFSTKQIKLALWDLPVVFEDVGIAMNYETFLEMNAVGCCDYRIEPPDVEGREPEIALPTVG